MKAPAVDYVRPRTLTEAVDLLAHASVEARVIAGGQSLLAMMNLRIASPGLLIDIARLPELLVVEDHGDAVTLGACITHAAIEDRRVFDPSHGLMPRVVATRSLAAILADDVAGYSRLMGADEEGTHERPKGISENWLIQRSRSTEAAR